MLGEVEGHKCANRRRNIWRIECESSVERNVNLEADLSVWVSLQAKKEARTLIWLELDAGAVGATAKADDVVLGAEEEAGPAGGPP